MERVEVIPKTSFSRPFAIAVAIVALLLGGAALWGANDKILGVFHDDGIYTVVAKSLYQGDGYRIISLPSAPPQTKYPFLYSYLISWIWKFNPIFPDNIAGLKSLNVAILVAIFIVSVIYYGRRFPDSTIGAIVFGLLVCTNPTVFTFTDYVVSDLLYVLLALTALTICSPGVTALSRASSLTLLMVVSGLAGLTRLAAAALVFAGSLHSLVSRSWWGAAHFIGGVLLFVTPWFLWVYFQADHAANSLFAYYSAYDVNGANVAEASGWLARHWPVTLGNVRYLIGAFDILYLLPLLPGLGLLVALLTAVGMIVSMRRGDIFTWSFFLSTLGLLLIWPFHPARYLAPLAPVLLMFLFTGMHAVQGWIESRTEDFGGFNALVTKLAWAPVLLVLMLNGVWLSSYLLIKDDETTRALFGNRLPYGWRGFEESFEWIHRNTQPDVLLATAYDPMYYLYTGRRAIRPALHRSATYFYPYGQPNPDVGSVDEIKPQLEKLGVKYLIIDPLDGYAEGKATLRLLGELVNSYGARAINVFTSSDGRHRIYALQAH